MADPLAALALGHTAVRPQVAAADARELDPHDDVGGLLDGRVRHLLDADVTGAMDRRSPHVEPPQVSLLNRCIVPLSWCSRRIETLWSWLRASPERDSFLPMAF